MLIIYVENFIVNFLVLFEVILFTKSKYDFFKHLFSSLILSSNIFLRNLNFLNNFFIFIIFVNFVIWFMFNNKNILKQFKYVWYFFIIYIEFIGIVIFNVLLFNLNIEKVFVRIILYLVVFVFVNIINNFTWKIWQNNLLNEKLVYKLYLPKFGIKFNLYLDTGNFLKDNLGIYEVILLNENKYLEKIKSKNIFSNLEEIKINVNTIGSSSILKGYFFENVIIENNNKNKFYFKKVIILFTDKNIINNKYDGLLGITTYLNKLKGVNL